MASDNAHRFMEALHRVEDREDVEAMAGLFDEDAELINPAREARMHGRDGARTFWHQYRDAFDRIHSEFTAVKEGEGFAVLEWHGEGTRANGEPLSYDGVSLLEYRDSRIRRFITYYDSSVFVGPGEKGAND